MICVGIYAVLIQNLSFSDNIISSIWGVMGYTVLLAFTLFKTEASQNPCLQRIKEGGMIRGILYFCTA